MQRPILAPSLLEDLATNNPFSAKPLPLDLVEAWWDATWPGFHGFELRRGPYRNRERAIRSWWSRAWPADLDRARVLLARQRLERAEEMQERLQREILPAPDAASLAAMQKILGGASRGI